ncbi:MAG: type IV pilus twitching motility protein PilT [Planctomycetota bacterium]
MDPLANTFCKVAIRNKLMTEEEASKCLLACGDGGKIAEVVVEQGVMSEAQAAKLKEAIENRASQRRPAAKPPEPKASAPAPAEAAEDSSASVGQAVDINLTPELEKEMAAGMDWSSLVGKSVNAYLESARNAKASDLHLNTASPPSIRINGSLKYMKHPLLMPEDTTRLVEQLLSEEQFATLKEKMELDLCYVSQKGNRYRCSVYKQRLGYAIISRIIPNEITGLKALGLPKSVARFTEYHQGLVLVTGPAGCGKTATLGALVDMINESRNDHIILLEEPIELIHESKKALISQREVGAHTDSFSAALRAALREDPDIIVVGEMRDLETISLAITAAETGHLVIGTLHTSNAAKTIDRLLDVFPPEEQAQIRAMVSESLRGIISQQLVPRKDGKGRALAVELMFSTTSVRNLIVDERTFQLRSAIQIGKNQGMRLLDESLARLVKKDIITREEALLRVEDPKLLDA